MDKEEKVVSSKDLDWNEEIVLFEGKPFSGVRIDYHENGSKKSEGHIRDGELNGLSTEWYPNGQKNWEVHMKNGKEAGLFTIW